MKSPFDLSIDTTAPASFTEAGAVVSRLVVHDSPPASRGLPCRALGLGIGAGLPDNGRGRPASYTLHA